MDFSSKKPWGEEERPGLWFLRILSSDVTRFISDSACNKSWQAVTNRVFQPLSRAEKQIAIIMPFSCHPSSIHSFIATLIPSSVWPQPSRCGAFDLWIYRAEKKWKRAHWPCVAGLEHRKDFHEQNSLIWTCLYTRQTLEKSISHYRSKV